jgi:hypothetical protein
VVKRRYLFTLRVRECEELFCKRGCRHKTAEMTSVRFLAAHREKKRVSAAAMPSAIVDRPNSRLSSKSSNRMI